MQAINNYLKDWAGDYQIQEQSFTSTHPSYPALKFHIKVQGNIVLHITENGEDVVEQEFKVDPTLRVEDLDLIHRLMYSTLHDRIINYVENITGLKGWKWKHRFRGCGIEAGEYYAHLFWLEESWRYFIRLGQQGNYIKRNDGNNNSLEEMAVELKEELEILRSLPVKVEE